MRESYSLASIKKEYDNVLKELENRKDDFRDDYDVYFKKNIFEKEIVNKMYDDDKERYVKGAGHELSEHKKDGKVLPPDMSSVASSSRFCYLSLKDTDFSVFGIKDKTFRRIFEEKMPITQGTPPHMDCYYVDDDELVCFECKCHEQFDNHDIKLAESYFKNDRLVSKIDEKYIIGRVEEEDKRGKKYFKKVIDPKVVCLSSNPRFDVKQFFTHLMGIQKRLRELKKQKARLIYYYFIPNEVLKNEKIKAVIDDLYSDIRKVCNSQFIKDNVKKISIELYVQFSNVVESASGDNTEKIKI